MGGSGSQQTSGSQSFSQAGSFVDPQQQQFLTALRNSSSNPLIQSIAGGGSLGNELASNLSERSLGLIDFASGPDAQNAQLGALGTNLGRFFSEGANEIQNRFGSGGTLAPGGRAGVTAGSLLGRAGDAFATGAADIIGSGADRALSGASLLPQTFNLGIGGFQGAALPALALADIIGDPTILNQARSSSSSFGSGETTTLSFF